MNCVKICKFSQAKIALARATGVVIAAGLGILGVEPAEELRELCSALLEVDLDVAGEGVDDFLDLGRGGGEAGAQFGQTHQPVLLRDDAVVGGE